MSCSLKFSWVACQSRFDIPSISCVLAVCGVLGERTTKYVPPSQRVPESACEFEKPSVSWETSSPDPHAQMWCFSTADRAQPAPAAWAASVPYF